MSSANSEDEEWLEEDDNNSDVGEGDDEDVSFRKTGRSMLWLCQEGQIQLARKRFEWLQQQQDQEEQLFKEIFHVGHDKNYALHEVLMGGTNDSNAYQLVRYILDYALQSPEITTNDAANTNTSTNRYMAARKMLAARPPSHQRTALHWAAWGNARLELLQALVKGYPEALVLRDRRNQNERTPAEILKHYFFSHDRRSQGSSVVVDTTRLDYLQRCTASWIQHRLRLTVHLSIKHWFGTEALTPFDNKDRQRSQIKPKAWFLLSLLGSLMQREMTTLVIHILGYLGHKARLAKTTAKRTSKSNPKKRKISAAGGRETK